MELLFKLTELESRIPLNMNVLSKGKVPKVMDLAEVLQRMARPPPRRAGAPLAATGWREIEHRLEVLGGYLIAYLNLDKVIKIIRNEDEPKPVLMKTLQAHRRAGRGHPQHAAAQLAQARGDGDPRARTRTLRAEKKPASRSCSRSEKEQWKTIAEQIKEVREKFGPKTPLGKRRTDFADAPEHDEAAIEEAMVEREPITVVVSEKGWIRALRGHRRPICRSSRSRTDDGLKFALPRRDHRRRSWCSPPTAASTRSTPPKLPGGRGHGEPVRLYHRHRAGRRTSSRCSAYQGGRKFLRGEHDGQRLRRARGRVSRQHPQGQAGAQRQAAGRGARDRAGRGRAWSRRSARTARW